MMVAITWGNINIEPCNHFHRIRYSHRAMAFPNNISRHWFKTVLGPKLEDCFVSYWCIFGRKERFPIGRLLCLPILIHLSFLPSDSRQAAQWRFAFLIDQGMHFLKLLLAHDDWDMMMSCRFFLCRWCHSFREKKRISNELEISFLYIHKTNDFEFAEHLLN